MDFALNEAEAKLLKKVLGHHHKDKDISDIESEATFALYKRIGALIKAHGKNTTKKIKKAD